MTRVDGDRYEALLLIAYHPAAEHVFETGAGGGEVKRDWRWEAESMRRIALDALSLGDRPKGI